MEKYEWLFIMGILFGCGMVFSLIALFGGKPVLIEGSILIIASIIGIYNTNNIFEI